MFNGFTRSAVFCGAAWATMIAGALHAEAQSASGGGIRIRPQPSPESPYITEQLGFNARNVGDDRAQGQIEHIVKRDGELRVYSHLRVDCLWFLDDNTVLVGGTVIQDIDPTYIGTTAIFAVRDHGEGNGAAVDERSGLYYSIDLGFEADCETVASLIASGAINLEALLTPIAAGDHQVNP